MTNEDFTTYTEVDIAANRIRNLSANSVEIYDVDLDERVYLYYNYGAGNIGTGRVIEWTVDLVSRVSNGRAWTPVFASDVDDWNHINPPALGVRYRSTLDPYWQIAMWEQDSGDNPHFDSYQHGNANQIQFWFTMTWNGDSLVLDIYDDDARTSLVDTLSLTLQDANYTFQYAYALQSDDQALGGRAIRYVLEDLDLGSTSGSEDLFAKFEVPIPSGSADLFAKFLLRQDTRDLFAEFEVGQGYGNLFTQFITRQIATSDLYAELVIRHTATLDLFSEFELQKSETLFAKFQIPLPGSAELKAEFHVGQDSENLPSQLIVRHSDTRDLYAKFGLLSEVQTYDIKAEFVVAQGSENLKYRALVNAFGYGVKGDRILNYTQGYIFGTKFTSGSKLSVADSIEFFYRKGVILQYARGAIYTVSGNYPGNLIEETTLIGPLTGDPDIPYWVSLPFTDKPILQPSTEYFILVWASRAPSARTRYTIPDATLKGFQRSMGSGPVDTFTSYDPMIGGTQRSWMFSILSTYDHATDATADLKATFNVGKQSKDLFAEFIVAQWQEDLHAEFTVNYGKRNLKAVFEVLNADSEDLHSEFITIRSASAEIFGEFIVRKKGTRDLYHKMFLTRPYANLDAEFIVRQTVTFELPAETIIRHTSTANLAAEAIITHSSTKELPAQFIVSRTTTKDLMAKFEIQRSNNLKGIFYLPTRSNKDAYYPIIDDDIKYWLNHLELAGNGFIGWPSFETDLVDKASGLNSLKVTSERIGKGFKEVTFGWLYEPVYLNAIKEEPCEGCRPEFDRLITEDWTDYEEYTLEYTAIEKDNTLKMYYNEDYGAGGLYLVDDNYGSAEYLGLSSFEGWLPGEIPSQRHRSYSTIAMKWNLDGLTGIDLTRFAWARYEMYRYSSGGMTGGPIKIYRMPDCGYIGVRGSPPVMGGCHSELLAYPNSSTGVYPSGTWTELGSNYRRMGYSEINHTFNRVYGNLDFYAAPSDGIGFSWENADWDKIDLSTLMLGWLNGIYNNHGMFVFLYSDPPYSSFTNYVYLNFQNEMRYYSRESSNDNKPVIRVMLQPENLRWTFQSAKKWDVNTVDPYSGSSCIRLKDWSKSNYVKYRTGDAHGGRPGMTLNDETPAEGYIDTAFRLNSETMLQVDMNLYGSGLPSYQWWLFEEETPLDNYFNIYFRYQDESNHYRVEFNKAGTSCRIRRESGGAVTTLNAFSGFKVSSWHKVRVYWTLNEDGDLKICCYKWDDEQEVWRFLGGATDTNDYWADGGEIYFEGLDVDVDETEVWEAA